MGYSIAMLVYQRLTKLLICLVKKIMSFFYICFDLLEIRCGNMFSLILIWQSLCCCISRGTHIYIVLWGYWEWLLELASSIHLSREFNKRRNHKHWLMMRCQCGTGATWKVLWHIFLYRVSALASEFCCRLCRLSDSVNLDLCAGL